MNELKDIIDRIVDYLIFDNPYILELREWYIVVYKTDREIRIGVYGNWYPDMFREYEVLGVYKLESGELIEFTKLNNLIED